MKPLRLLMMILIVYLGGCTNNAQIRDAAIDCHQRTETSCLAKSSIEEYPTYSLGFVEFDDQGWAYDQDHRQMNRLLKKLDEAAQNHDQLLIVVYVHGWRHNADYNDDNVQEFRKTLQQLSNPGPLPTTENQKVFGVYVGWRGLSLIGHEIWESLSFYARKEAADRVAKGSVRELFARLRNFTIHQNHQNIDNVADHPERVKFLIVGHSFGGLIVYTALSEFLMESSVAYPGDEEKNYLTPFADLVVLVNPAFEASRYEALHQIVRTRGFKAGQLPIFISLTTSNDWATKYAFYAGRWINSLLESERGNSLQKEANKNTLGHVARYHTHILSMCEPDNAVEIRATDCGCPGWQGESSAKLQNGVQQITESAAVPTQDLLLEQQKSLAFHAHWTDPRTERLKSGWQRNFCGNLQLQQLHQQENGHPETPIWNVYTDNNIIDGHGGFHNSHFRDFLRQIMHEPHRHETQPH